MTHAPKKLLLLGANGRTGREVLRYARSLGLEVTAVVRSPDRMPTELTDGIRLCTADPCSAAALTPLVAGQDVVVSTLGPRWPTARAASVYPRSAEAIVAAMQRQGVRRLLVTSSAMLYPQRRLLNRFLKRTLANLFEAATAMETRIGSTDLDWTIARTSYLNDRDTAHALVLTGPEVETMEPNGAVSRTAVARYLVDEAVRGAHRRKIRGLFGVPRHLSSNTSRWNGLGTSSATTRPG